MIFPLTEAEEAEFNVCRNFFFRSSKPQIPATQTEYRNTLLVQADNPVKTMELAIEEQGYADKSMAFVYAKKKYPNSKLFYDYTRRSGVGHMYFKDGNFICQINGKITASQGNLGTINKDNINLALNKMKGKYVSFNNDKFIEKAQVLLAHVTNDIEVSDASTYTKALSSYMPLRTDKYSVLKYGNNGFEVLPRGKQSTNSAKHSFCIYWKWAEIGHSNQYSYINAIDKSGMALAVKTLRFELKLYNYKAIRRYLAPGQEDGTITLRELLDCTQTPIINKLEELEITLDQLKQARGEYIEFKEQDKLPSLAVFQRMHGIIHLLKLNDYSLDKVRNYLEVETGKKVRSDELQKNREALQRYIACYKPRTVALLTELLACMSY